MELTKKVIRDNLMYDEYLTARNLYNEFIEFDREFLFAISAVYKAGIIEGKRQDRARRKRSV